MSTETDRVAEFVAHVESIDSTDLANVGDASLNRKVVDWGFVSHVDSYPDASTVTVSGDDLAMQANLEIHLNDQSVITVAVAIEANDSDGILGLRNVSVSARLEA